ncbi:ring-cleaving dioxygenase [Paenibacillus hamazuiensis]|uniref:ring-cleaving dioxygenase n=1 Tax=Paenibacillus hamazuiensis TaxID=2936508 RepID=UPI00200FA7E4|nr:ring-cleaving dioxygenase [Paenibacillus hamazuiensis]
MILETAGIHHITAFARNPQDNVNFYAGVLGLRLVKKTVNFDATEVYHLYFGDQSGNPGTVITFFPYPNYRRGEIGGGQVGITAFAVPPGSLDFWEKRLNSFGITPTKAIRFQQSYLQFCDNEGLQLEIVEREEGLNSSWSFGGIPADKAIKGLGGAVLFSVNAEKTIHVLENVLGLKKLGVDAGYARFQSPAAIGNLIDVALEDKQRGHGGAGTVHHIAWRAKDFQEHEEWHRKVTACGFAPTQILDRKYFKALYFREDGGILFEIATDPPGFARDEAPDALGQKLMLPEWFEPLRGQIEDNLPQIEVKTPDGDKG